MEIATTRLAIGLGLVFLLGILFAIVNGEYASTENNQLPLIVYGISFVSLLIGATLVLLFQWRLNRMHIEKMLSMLPKDERTILTLLISNNNQLEQNKIVVLSGYTKVQVFRILQRLAARNVIEKKPMGNTNLVLLKI